METGEKDVKKKSEGKKWGGGQCIKFPTDCKLYIIIVKYFEQIVNNEHYLVNVVVISIMRNYIHVTNKNRHKYHKQELEFYPSYTSQISIHTIQFNSVYTVFLLRKKKLAIQIFFT